jgi:LuxR family maltose regulon positive regulatory protein
VVVVCAGTGYGKTCAVYDYLHNSDAFRVWIQITERDNNVAHFWEHFIHSLSFYAKETAAKLIEEGFPATDSAFENYLRIPEEDITVNRKYVFVYDDFHLIHDKAVLRFIERSVNSDFPNITTVLITHTEPSINLIQLQAKGKVANITESELRFTEDEVSEYLRRQEIIVSSQNVMAICRDTEGWAFALNLIGMVLKNRPDDLHHATVTMKSNVFKLLELEVFFNLTEPMRRLLLRLSLIDQQPGELVYQIADDPNLVLELESVSSYLRYDSYIDTYLFHHLFRDYLRQKQDLLTQEEKNDTYLIAARWCEEHNYKIDAITYYEKSGHFDALARIAYDLPVQISVATSEYLLGIIDKIPAEQRMGIVLYPAIKLRLLINLRRLDEASALAHQYLAQFESLPVTAFNDRVLTGIYTAIAYIRFASALTTDIYDFDIYFKKADEHYTRHPFTVSGPTRNHVLGPWISWVGTTRKEAHEEYISALERSVPHVAHYLGGRMAGMDNLARGEFYFFQNDLQAAEQYVTRAMISSRENNQSTIHGRALFYLMRICLAHGDYARIEQIIGELETLSKTRNYANGQVRFDLVTSRYHLMLGQPQLVTDWLKLDFEKAALPRFLEDTSNFIKMKFHYVTQRYHPLLAFISSDKRLKKFLFGRIELKVMEAVCHYQIKDRVAALSALCEAHELSLSNKLIMPFVEFGKDMRTLTTAAMRDKSVGIPRAWLELINRKSTTYAKRLRLVTKAYKKAHRLGDEITLSPRESEVLADLCQGLSRSEIAVAHNLSINTVKLVVNALYIKLDAGNIADLIRIAVEKKLIP